MRPLGGRGWRDRARPGAGAGRPGPGTAGTAENPHADVAAPALIKRWGLGPHRLLFGVVDPFPQGAEQFARLAGILLFFHILAAFRPQVPQFRPTAPRPESIKLAHHLS